MADEIGVNGTISTVSNHGVKLLLGILLMGLNHLLEHLTVINGSGGNLRGGDDLVFLIDSSMRLIWFQASPRLLSPEGKYYKLILLTLMQC